MSSLQSGGAVAVARVRTIKSGRARMVEIAAENKVVIDALVNDLLTSLGRPALPAEKLTAEAIAAGTVRARRLREQGKCDTVLMREVSRLLRSSPFRSGPSARAARPAAATVAGGD